MCVCVCDVTVRASPPERGWCRQRVGPWCERVEKGDIDAAGRTCTEKMYLVRFLNLSSQNHHTETGTVSVPEEVVNFTCSALNSISYLRVTGVHWLWRLKYPQQDSATAGLC